MDGLDNMDRNDEPNHRKSMVFLVHPVHGSPFFSC